MLRVKWKTLECIHLDSMYYRLSLQNTLTLMGLFGYADAHGYFSINDIQFWGLMFNLTDMPTEMIINYFFKFDCDYTGEMTFVEFLFLCCCMIASKDRVTKEFLQRHFRTLLNIHDPLISKHNYVTVTDFVRIGALMGWNLGTIERIYQYWDRDLELDRFRIRTDFAKTFILFAIDHERATHSRRRVACIKEFKRRWLLGLEDLIRDYYLFDALPPPALLWARMTGTDPPSLRIVKDTSDHAGCCQYCFLGICILLTLPWFIGIWVLWKLWSHAPWFRNIIIFCQDLLVCKQCRVAVDRIVAKQSLDAGHKRIQGEFPPDSVVFYNRNKRLAKKRRKFRYLQTQRELRGLFERTDPWDDSWLRAQLRLEAMEKQLLRNRLKANKDTELVMQDTFGVTAIEWKKFVSSKPKLLAYPKLAEVALPAPRSENLPINLEAPELSKYPARFMRNFTAREILTAEHQIKEKEYRRTKGDSELRRRKPLRQTVFGPTRLKQIQTHEQARLNIVETLDKLQKVPSIRNKTTRTLRKLKMFQNIHY